MKFVVAVRRDRRGEGLTAARAGAVAGVTVLGSDNPERAIVETSAAGAEEVRQRFGGALRVEPLIQHDLLGASLP